MNDLSAIYEYLVGKLEGLFPEKQQLFNPYDVATNNELMLKDGFGIGFGAFSERGSVGRCLKMSHDILIPLTKRFYALENDEATRMEFEQDLMEEAFDLILALLKDQTLGGTACRVSFQGSPGVQQIFQEKQPYIFATLTFNVEYNQNLP